MQNQWGEASIGTRGAELLALRPCAGENLLWEASPKTWNRTAPTVFPILGGWPDDRYTVDGQAFTMQRNGFARTQEFTVLSKTPDSCCLMLESNLQTLQSYPFEFRLLVWYCMSTQGVRISYEITNTGRADMPWIAGAHPGFAWDRRNGWKIRFAKPERTLFLHPDGSKGVQLDGESGILLTPRLFSGGALSTCKLDSRWVELVPPEAGRYRIRINRMEFPCLTLWSMDSDQARFVCIEPSTGVGGTERDLRMRRGIRTLRQGYTETRSLCIECVPVKPDGLS